MTDRDEYLRQFKAKLDEWNADIDRLEAKAREVQADAQSEYQRQLAALRDMRDDALKQYGEMQNAAAEAWDTLVEGSEKAWQAWADAFADARSKLKPKG